MTSLNPFHGALMALSLAAAVLFSPTEATAQETTPDRLTEVFGDWTVRCRTTDNGNDCRAQQIRTRGDNNVRTLSLYLRTSGDGSRATVIVPLGVALPAGVTVKVGDDTVAQVAFAICRQAGCVAQMPLDETRLAAFRAGTTGTVLVRAGNGSPVELPISLTGFTRAWERLSELEASAQ